MPIQMKTFSPALTFSCLLALYIPVSYTFAQQPATPTKESTAAPNEAPWPQVFDVSADTKVTLYQPQIDTWDGFAVTARIAARVDSDKDKPPQYGILNVKTSTMTDKGTRMVTIIDAQVTKIEFPSATAEQTKIWSEAITKNLAGKTRVIALDRLEASAAVNKAEKSATSKPLLNDPPKIIFSDAAAILVSIDGDPLLREVKGSSLQRVINTRPLLLRDSSGAYFIKVFDGWMSAGTLTAPWNVVPARKDLDKAFKEANAAHSVDPLTGQGATDQPAPKLADKAPRIFIAMRPTELIVTEGPQQLTPLDGTKLLYVSNTTGNVFVNTTDNKAYVLIAGRWFKGEIKGDTWAYVAANALPPDFAAIPDNSPKENVKASIAGTAQSKEAAVAAEIPQVAAVTIAGTKPVAPKIDGEPVLKPIDGTTLSYVANSPTPIIRTSATGFYAVENGVWFVATKATGPWAVTTYVPSTIYAIPASSPLHYVTYVHIYNATPTVVYVGYTPGYQGTYIDPFTGVVVYGTGYVYNPWVGTYWYGAPVTYGYGAAVAYTPWTGWQVAFCVGWMWGATTTAWGWGWGPYPYWGPWAYPAWHGVAIGPRGGAVAWGPGGWAGYSGNIYSQWGSRAQVSRYSRGYNAWTGNEWAGKAGASYNSRTGIATAGQRGAVQNVYTGNYAAGSRGAASGRNFAAVGERGTAGNAYTGDSVSGARGAVVNKNTGEVTKYGHVTGDGGTTVGHIGDDVYAGKDGNVYRNNGDGWQKHQQGSGWSDVNGGINQGAATRDATGGLGASQGGHLDNLDHERAARDWGDQRTGQFHQSMGAARSFHGGGFRRR